MNWAPHWNLYIWNSLSVEEVALIVADGGTLPLNAEHRRERLVEAMERVRDEQNGRPTIGLEMSDVKIAA